MKLISQNHFHHPSMWQVDSLFTHNNTNEQSRSENCALSKSNNRLQRASTMPLCQCQYCGGNWLYYEHSFSISPMMIREVKWYFSLPTNWSFVKNGNYYSWVLYFTINIIADGKTRNTNSLHERNEAYGKLIVTIK